MPGFQSEYQRHWVSSDEIHPGILSFSTNNPFKKVHIIHYANLRASGLCSILPRRKGIMRSHDANHING